MSLITIQRTIVVRDDPRTQGQPRRRWTRRATAAAGLLIAAAAGGGVAVAVAAPQLHAASTTDVPFVPLNPPFKLFTNRSFAANAKLSSVVIGGSTKVPTNATTVELTVSAGGSKDGSMTFYPAGFPGGASGDSLSWTAGGSDSRTIEENVGAANQLTFANGGTAATVTATIIGYSTKVTAGDIAPADGIGGQVLTNTGGGAAWQDLPTKTAYTSTHPTAVSVISGAYSNVDAVTVPAGTYVVSATYGASALPADFAECRIVSPEGNASAVSFADVNQADLYDYYGSGSVQAVVATGGGAIRFQCYSVFNNNVNVFGETLIATQVDHATGAAVAARTRLAAPLPGRTK
jgi:hypothetical protein